MSTILATSKIKEKYDWLFSYVIKMLWIYDVIIGYDSEHEIFVKIRFCYFYIMGLIHWCSVIHCRLSIKYIEVKMLKYVFVNV